MRRRDALGALLTLPSLPTPSQAQPGAPLRTRPLREGLGLNVKFGQGQPLRDLPMLTELGVRWVRDFVPWRQVEPRAGQREAGPAAWRQRLDFYRQHDIGVVCLLTLKNDEAYAATDAQPLRPVDPQAFAEHALQMAKQLREAGVRFVLEIGNEPHNGFLPKLVGGHWSGRAAAPWIDHYVRMTKAAVQAVKAFDPKVRLLTDDDLWVVHHRYLDAGLPAALDGFAVHPYSPTPERVANQDADWIRPYQPADADRSVASAVRRLREHGERQLGHRPEIWFTEWGCPVGDKAPQQTTEALQAARLPRAFILAEAAGVEALCWFSSHDAHEGSFGLLTNGGARRPAYDAMRTLSAELGDWRLTRQVLGQAQPTQGLQAYLFEHGDMARWVLWQADEVDASVRLSGPLAGLSAVNGLGQSVVPRDSGIDARTWTIGALPVYLAPLPLHQLPQDLAGLMSLVSSKGLPA